MKKTRIVTDYLRDIVDAADAVAEFLSATSDLEEFQSDRKTIFAVTRAFEVMGEASKNIPTGFRRQHGQVPWREMARMRDKVIHAYFGVDAAVMWKTAHEELPNVRAAVARILDEEERRLLL